MEQDDVVRQFQRPTPLMPACTIANDHGAGARSDLGTDFGEMEVHALGIGAGRDQGGADPARWADRAKQVGVVVAIVAHHQRPRAYRSPYISVPALLPDPGFILELDLNRCRVSGAEQGLCQKGTEVFLKASSVAGAFLG